MAEWRTRQARLGPRARFCDYCFSIRLDCTNPILGNNAVVVLMNMIAAPLPTIVKLYVSNPNGVLGIAIVLCSPN